jgi:putative hydrolase of the HAD superfamily
VTTAKESPTVLALTFDCFGTLIDWESGLKQALQDEGVFDAIKMPWAEFLRAREKKEAEWEALPYRHYREILAMSLRETFASFAASLDEPTALRVSDSIRRWPAFPDTVSALRRLGSQFPMLILSNVDRAPLQAVVQRLGIPFAELITAEDVRAYKPAPAHFNEAKKRLGGRAEGQLHVAASLFHDLEPAQKAGVATTWVNRAGDKQPEGLTPRFVVKDLIELCKKLGV